MSNVTFNVRLDDIEGMENVLNFISGYVNSIKVREAQERNPLVSEDMDAPEDFFVAGKTEADSDLDSAGQPWDPDKHSAKRTKLEDGTWRKKRQPKTKDEKPVPPPPTEEAGMAPEEIGYKQMMDYLKGKGLGLTEMNALAQQVGVDSIGLLINRPDIIPAVIALADSK